MEEEDREPGRSRRREGLKGPGKRGRRKRGLIGKV